MTLYYLFIQCLSNWHAERRLSLVAGLLLFIVHLAPAQAPVWNAALSSSLTQASGKSQVQAITTDANGNVLVTGSFSGQVAFGNTLLSSQGFQDLFVAKYLPATGTWAWAQSGGGTSNDQGLGIAVSGTNIYVTGGITNNTANSKQVVFGGSGAAFGGVPVSGASSTVSQDLVVVKYTDQGTTAVLGWTQVGGGSTDDDLGTGVAVSGTNVYVTGYIRNTLANAKEVVFGGTGTALGTVQVNGTSSNPYFSDLLLVKYTDNNLTATLGWTQVGGGNGSDQGGGVAVSGTTVYVTGHITNDAANRGGVVFGGSGIAPGTLPVAGVSNAALSDLVLAKYRDEGSYATLVWTEVGGGRSEDHGLGIAINGTSVYVTGYITNNITDLNKVVFGNAVQVKGASSYSFASSQDLLVAKYTDNGNGANLNWTQVGGGIYDDAGLGIAVSGTSVYVTGYIKNNTANAGLVIFGSSGTTPDTTPVYGVGSTTRDNYDDLVLAKYTDLGGTATSSWVQVGGGANPDQGVGVAVSGTSVYTAGYVQESLAFTFGAASPKVLGGTISARAILAQVNDQGAAGSWQTLAAAFNGGSSKISSVATDADGSVFVTGTFYGQVYFGSTLLTSLGKSDLFVAKYAPATATWAWVQSGGGLREDEGMGIAVSGTSVYVTGYISNTAANDCGVIFGGTGTTPGTVPVNGAGTGNSLSSYEDLLVIKYTDQGTNATLNWTQVGGGRHSDQGLAVAVSGPNVYVTGYISNTAANDYGVVFGGSGTTPGTVPVNGACTGSNLATYEDLVVAKYIDQGNSAILGWTQVGGGNSWDEGTSIAVSGTNVYVTGYISNTAANDYGVVFGGSGTTPGTVPISGTTSASNIRRFTDDLIVIKYLDQGTAATLGWTQVGGGSASDRGRGVAVNGTNVYVTGYIMNNAANLNQVVFGGSGTIPGTVQVNGTSTGGDSSVDLLVLKYTDQGTTATLGWTQVGGGSGSDMGLGIAVSGTNVYVAGYISNTTANDYGVVFGGTGITPGIVPVSGLATGDYIAYYTDLVLIKYSDQGTTATLGWTQVGGGSESDAALGVAVSGTSIYTTGYVTSSVPTPSFGTYTIGTPVRSGPFFGNLGNNVLVLARVTDLYLPLATVGPQATNASLLLTVSPNPSLPNALVQATGKIAHTGTAELLLTDVLGRTLWQQTVQLTGGISSALPVPALPSPGLYMLRLRTADGHAVSTRIVRE